MGKKNDYFPKITCESIVLEFLVIMIRKTSKNIQASTFHSTEKRTTEDVRFIFISVFFVNSKFDGTNESTVKFPREGTVTSDCRQRANDYS
jgi:hypothetical protein